MSPISTISSLPSITLLMGRLILKLEKGNTLLAVPLPVHLCAWPINFKGNLPPMDSSRFSCVRSIPYPTFSLLFLSPYCEGNSTLSKLKVKEKPSKTPYALKLKQEGSPPLFPSWAEKVLATIQKKFLWPDLTFTSVTAHLL